MPLSPSEETNRKSLPGNTKLQKRFTEPSDLIDTETYIVRPEQHRETTDLPVNNSYDYQQKHKKNSVIKNRDNVHDVIPRQPNEPYASNHMLPNMDHNTYEKQHMSHNVAYQNHMMIDNFEYNVFKKNDSSDAHSELTESNVEERHGSKPDVSHNITYQTQFMTDNPEENVFRKSDRAEQTAYSELTEPNVEEKNDSKKYDKSSKMAYQNRIMTDNSEDNVFRKMDRSEQTSYSDHMETNGFTTPYADINPDYDKMEQDTDYEIEEEDTNNYVHEDTDKTECNDRFTCSVGQSSTENVSDKAGKEGDGGKLDNTMDRFIDDSVKIFKNSFTIKFPTFERIANKISEWFQFVFGMKSRDEGKILHY
jgi:hypothetical protein